MKLVNKHWYPFISELSNLADKEAVEKIVFIYKEDANAAGLFDPDIKTICVNIAPNCLADVADRYGLKITDFERIAVAVFLEEAVHSHGVTNETVAATMATMLLGMVPEEKFGKQSIFTYINEELRKCNADTAENGHMEKQ